MSALSIWMFRTAGGAEVALRILDDLRADQLVTVDDAAAVSWPDDRRTPRTWQDCCLTGPNALAGAFWGLLFGIVFLLPLTGPAIGATSGLAAGSLAHIGLSDELLQRLRKRITPGSSALFLLTSDVVLERIREALAGTTVDLLTTNLSAKQEAGLRHAFNDDTTAAR